jgi:hypothetical protein
MLGPSLDSLCRRADRLRSDDIASHGRTSDEDREVLVNRLPHIAPQQRPKRSRATASWAVDAEQGPDGTAKPQPRR